MLKSLVTLAALLFAVAVLAQPSQVIVVRHAERATEPKNDPALSPEGQQRAELLAETLASANVQAIVTTHYRRTQETAAPLAKRFGLLPTVLPIRPGPHSAHIAEVVAAVRKLSGVVLVVGHSNTVADIVAGLSSSTPVPLCETSFSNLFVSTQGSPAVPALQLKYGKPDRPPASGCQ